MTELNLKIKELIRQGELAIKVLQFMPGVASKPIHPNDPSVIQPDEPWISWAKNEDKSGGQRICEFVKWPGAETKEEEKKDGEDTPPSGTDDKKDEAETPAVTVEKDKEDEGE